jgi:hypothetical protein
MNNAKFFSALIAVLTALTVPVRLHAECWKYHVDHVFPCAISTVTTPAKSDCPDKSDLKPKFPQYVCDYIGVGGIYYSIAKTSKSQGKRVPVKSPPANISGFNGANLSAQNEIIDFSRQAYADYLKAISIFLKRSDPREIRDNYPAKVRLAMASREYYAYPHSKLTHVLRPFLGKEIVAKYLSTAQKGVHQNTWHWKAYWAPIQKRRSALEKIKNQATQAYLRQKRSEIAKELGTKYGAQFKSNYDAAETAVNTRYAKGKTTKLLPLAKPSYIVKAPPSPAFLPNNLNEIALRNYFSISYSLDPYDPKGENFNLGDLRRGLDRISAEAKVAIWHALGMTQTVGNPEQKVPLVFRQYNGTCGIAALTQYMQAHGQKVTVQELSKISRDRGISDFSGDNPGSWGATGAEGQAAQTYGYHSDDSFWMTFPPGAKENKSDPYYDGYIKRYQNQDQKRLEDAIRANRGAIVSVASKVLWGPLDKWPAYPDHYVYVTGEEINSSTNKILGYYINDSGTGEGGRFVDAKTFLRAWIYGGDEIAIIAPIPGLAKQ